MRFDQCTEICTTDCGHCKGRPVEALRSEIAKCWDEIHLQRQRHSTALEEIALLAAERDHWKGLAEEPPEPCPLDHGCDPEETCGCWCMLHDCAIDECPTFKTVEGWLKHLRQEGQRIARSARAALDGAPGEATP